MRRVLIPVIGVLGLLMTIQLLAEDRDKKVREDRSTVKKTGQWIYDDLNQGLATARRTGKPLMIVFR